MNNLQPRIRGAAYQKEDGSWSWEAVLTLGDMPVDHPDATVVGCKNKSFISKQAAIDDLRKASVDISKEVGRAMGATEEQLEKTKYLDLTKGAEYSTEKQFLSKSPFGRKFF